MRTRPSQPVSVVGTPRDGSLCVQHVAECPILTRRFIQKNWIEGAKTVPNPVGCRSPAATPDGRTTSSRPSTFATKHERRALVRSDGGGAVRPAAGNV